MVDHPVPQLMGQQGQNRAREILGGIGDRRIDPKRIKTTETEPRAKGGQGTVIIGTMIAPEEIASWDTKQLMATFLNRKLAIKKLEWDRQDAEASAKFFKSFVNELSIMASLSHPNIVEFIGFVEDEQKGDAWIIIPWEANGNIREFLQSGEWDIPERVSLVQDVIGGVVYLHTRQPPICHGDLKSLNILVNSSYRAVITDFGSARSKQNVEAATATGNTLPVLSRREADDDRTEEYPSPKIELDPATLELTLTGPGFSLRWTAPEVLNNGVQDLPSDMWAIGWICWEIFTGRVPFEELNFQGAIISHVMKGKLPAIREEAELSHILELCSLMSDCWISNPVKRIDAPTFRLKAHWVPSTRHSSDISGGEKLRSAALLQELGTMYRLQDNAVMAESHYRTAINIATQTKDDRAKAVALVGLGLVYLAQSRHEEGEQALREAHEIHSRISNDLGAANALDCLGDMYRSQSRYQEAEKAFWEGYKIHSRFGNDLGTASTLDGLGRVYRAQSNYRDAEEALKEAHEIHSRIGNDSGIANAFIGLGDLYRNQSRYQEAEKVFMAAHEICFRIGDERGAANALRGLGNIYRTQSRNQEAQKALNDAQNIYSRIGDRLGAANVLRNLGQLYSEQCKYNDAEALFLQAAAAHDRAGDGGGKAGALLDLGKDYYSQARYSEAEEAATEALALSIGLASEDGQASASLLLSRIFQAQSRQSKEKEALIQAEAALARIGPPMDAARATTLDRLGDIHLAQSTYDAAEECYRLAKTIWSRVEKVSGEATELLSLGVLYVRQSRHGEAEECFTQARAAYARIADRNGEAKALEGLIGVHVLQHNFEDAKAVCVEARELYAQMGRPMSAACAKVWQLLQVLEQTTGSSSDGTFQV